MFYIHIHGITTFLGKAPFICRITNNTSGVNSRENLNTSHYIKLYTIYLLNNRLARVYRKCKYTTIYNMI